MEKDIITTNTQNHNISIDVLRIMAMLMVTVLHATGHGLKMAKIEVFSVAYWIVLLFNTFSLVAVNCFVLISGYFLSKKNTSPQKLLSLWLQVWTYSVGIYVVLCLMPSVNVGFSIERLIECFCPLLSNQYWFFTCYFLLYLISPILNKLITVWSRQEYKRTLIVLIVVFSLIPSVNIWGDSFGTNCGYGLIWFIVLYLIAAYIRKYSPLQPVRLWMAYMIPCVILCSFRIAINVWNPDHGSIQAILNGQTSYNGPLVLCASLGLFLGTVQTTFKASKKIAGIITTVASLSFGVYLLQDHAIIRSILWNDWVCLAEVVDCGGLFLFRVVLIVAILFVAGIVVEFVRRKIMGCLALVFPIKNISDWRCRDKTNKLN